jgi:hypothetical protein
VDFSPPAQLQSVGYTLAPASHAPLRYYCVVCRSRVIDEVTVVTADAKHKWVTLELTNRRYSQSCSRNTAVACAA